MPTHSIKNKLVVIGAAGYWGSKVTQRAVEMFGAGHVVALDVDRESLLRLSENIGESNLHIETILDDILHKPEYSHFFVATPPKFHYEVTKRILSCGRNVIVTKPMTLDANSAAELAGLAMNNNAVLKIDSTFLFHPVVKRMISEVKAGNIGKPKSIYTEWFGSGKLKGNIAGLKPSDGIDTIWDLAPHPLSILLELWQPPIAVSCRIQDESDGLPTEAVLFLTQITSGQTATIRVSWLDVDKARKFKVRGSHHTIIFDDAKDLSEKLIIKGGPTAGSAQVNKSNNQLKYNLQYQQEQRIDTFWQEPLQRELLDFMQEASNDTETQKLELDKSVLCVRILQAAHHSAQANGRDIFLD